MAMRYSVIANVNETRQHDLANGYVAVACDCVNATGYNADFASAHVIEDLLIKK